MDLPHLPALRLGRAYESLEKTDVLDHRSGEPVAAVSHVNAGIIRRDLVRPEASRATLRKFTCAQLIEMCRQAAEVLLSIGADSREEVDQLAKKAAEAGVTVFSEPGGEGWMYGAGFADLDGHRWNVLYMDGSRMP